MKKMVCMVMVVMMLVAFGAQAMADSDYTLFDLIEDFEDLVENEDISSYEIYTDLKTGEFYVEAFGYEEYSGINYVATIAIESDLDFCTLTLYMLSGNNRIHVHTEKMLVEDLF